MDEKDEQSDELKIEADEDRDDSVVSEEAAAETIKKLRAKLKESEKKAEDYLSGWQRSQADFINYKKRQASEQEDFLKFAATPVISDIIEAMDDFDTAFRQDEWQKVDKVWRDGIERIYGRLKSALEKNGVLVLNPEGQIFNPAEHLAVEMVNVKKADDDGKVMTVVHKGYALNGRVIRPAKVKVGSFAE